MTTSNLELRLQSYGIALVRMAVGIVFAAHGAQKLFQFGLAGTAGFFEQTGLPFPMASAAVVIAVELVGGLALALGLSTRLIALPLAAVVLVATLVVHLPAGFFLPQGMEFTLVLLAASIGLVLTGPGAFALDHVIRVSPEAAVLTLFEKRRPEVKAAA